MKVCVICGKEFEPRTYHHKYCTKQCAYEVDKRRNRLKYQTPEGKAYHKARLQNPKIKEQNRLRSKDRYKRRVGTAEGREKYNTYMRTYLRQWRIDKALRPEA